MKNSTIGLILFATLALGGCTHDSDDDDSASAPSVETTSTLSPKDYWVQQTSTSTTTTCDPTDYVCLALQALVSQSPFSCPAGTVATGRTTTGVICSPTP